MTDAINLKISQVRFTVQVTYLDSCYCCIYEN